MPYKTDPITGKKKPFINILTLTNKLMKKSLTLLILLVTVPALAYSQGSIGISAQGGMTLPIGDFGDYVKPGYGGTGFLFFELSPGIEITATSGKFMWDLDSEEADVTLSSIPLLLGVRYYLGEGGVAPYAALQGGLHFLKTEGMGFVGETEEFGYGIGGGLLFRVSNNFFFDLGVKYNSISDSEASDYSTEYLSFMAGLRIAFK